MFSQTTTKIGCYDTVRIEAYVGVAILVLVANFICATSLVLDGHVKQLDINPAIPYGICPLSRG